MVLDKQVFPSSSHPFNLIEREREWETHIGMTTLHAGLLLPGTLGVGGFTSSHSLLILVFSHHDVITMSPAMSLLLSGQLTKQLERERERFSQRFVWENRTFLRILWYAWVFLVVVLMRVKAMSLCGPVLWTLRLRIPFGLLEGDVLKRKQRAYWILACHI